MSIIHTDQRWARLGVAVAFLCGWLVVTALPASADADIGVRCDEYVVDLSGYPEAARGVSNTVSIFADTYTVESRTLFSSSFSIRQNWTEEIREKHTLIVRVFANRDQDGSDGLTFEGIYHAEDCFPHLTASATCDGWTVGASGYKPPGTLLSIEADNVMVSEGFEVAANGNFLQIGSWATVGGDHWVRITGEIHDELTYDELGWISIDSVEDADCPGATTATTLPAPTTPTTFDSSAPTTTDATMAGDQVSDTPEASSSTTLVATSTTVDLSSGQNPSDAPGSVAAGSSPGPPSSTNPIVLVLAAIGLASIGGVLLVKRLQK